MAEREKAHRWNPSASGGTASASPSSEPQEERREKQRKHKKSRGGEEEHVLAAETKTKDSSPRKEAPGPRPAERWCSVHNTSRHDLTECNSVKGLAERVWKYELERREGRRNEPKDKAPAVSNEHRREEAKGKAPADGNDDVGYQQPNQTVATIDGRARAYSSCREFNTMKRELLAAVPSPEASRKSKWSGV